MYLLFPNLRRSGTDEPALRPISLLTLHPTNIAQLKLSEKSPMGLGVPPLEIKMMPESNPPKSTMLVGRLGVSLPYNRRTALATGSPYRDLEFLLHKTMRRPLLSLSLSLAIYIYIERERERDIYIYILIYTHVYIHVCVYIYIYIYIYICTHAHMCICVYVWIHIYIYIYICMIVLIYIYIYMYNYNYTITRICLIHLCRVKQRDHRSIVERCRWMRSFMVTNI